MTGKKGFGIVFSTFTTGSLTIVIVIRARRVRAFYEAIVFSLRFNLYGEFDPGSERTLAAYLTHASRTRNGTSVPEYSGERVRNT